MRNERVKNIALLGLLTSVAILLSYVELLLPPVISAIPGIKMGLANVVVLFALYRLGTARAVAVSAVRLAVVTLLFGNLMMLLYSVGGAVLSLAVMAVLKKMDFLSLIGVSVAGAICHNLGQVLVAMVMLGTAEIGYYMIALTVSAIVSGIAVGILSGMALKRLKK